MFSFTTVQAFAIPTVMGKVVLTGTGAALPNIWVKWTEDFGTPYQSAYRFAQTDNNGIYTFPDLSTLPPGQESKILNNPIDTNSDNVNDDVEMFVDFTKPIPNASAGANEFFHFNAANSPHAFTAVVPNGLSGTFADISNITINDANTSMTLPDIVFTPATAAATPTPAPIYTISGNVFNDTNKNGIKDLLESGYAGATITLTGDSSATATSNNNGDYSFPNLYAGSYTVAIAVPNGYNITTSSSSNITLAKNQTLNFGLEKAIIGSGCTASITGTVYNDLNVNGDLDTGETPIPNWTVNLDAAGLPSPLTTTTNSSGVYTFTGLCTGIFTVTQSVTPPWYTTKSLSIVLIVIDGNNYTNINFFDAEEFTISGHAFLDPNGDGILNAGSSGFKGVTVILTGTTASGPVFKQVSTPADGYYLFSDLQVGEYKLLFGMVSGYRSTTPNVVNIDLTDNFTTDYGLTPTSVIKVGGACNGNTLDIMLVIDLSGSMNGIDSASGKPKIDESKEAASVFVDTIMQSLPTARIGIVRFSDSDNFDVNNTGNSYPSSLLNSPTGDVNQLKTTINNLAAITGAWTCTQCGVQIANKALNDNTRPNSQKMIVLLTDGWANEATYDPGVVLDPLDAENAAIDDIMAGINQQNIIYNTIGLGAPGTDENTSVDEAFLKAVAYTNSGTYYNDPSNGDLNQIFLAIAAKSTPTGGITGLTYDDKDMSKSFTSGDVPIAGMPVTLTGKNLTAAKTINSDSDGTYGFYGLCDSNGNNYTVTENPFSPWFLTTTGTYNVTISGGSESANKNFGNRYGYQISGSVFNDLNKNKLKDPTDEAYTGNVSILSQAVTTSTNGTVTINPNGTYLVTGLYPGQYKISFTSPLPKGYNFIWPVNGPPPLFAATVGPGCTVDSTTGAACTNNNDITNLNFSISNSIPWIQSYGLDIRFDNGFTNLIPAGTTCGGGSYASGTMGTNGPGIVFSGDRSTDFGNGSASPKNWVAGGTFPEVYGSKLPLKTSTANLVQSAKKAGIYNTIDSIASCKNPDRNCNIQGMQKGFYHVAKTQNNPNGDLLLDSNIIFSTGPYVIVAEGTITLSKGMAITTTASASDSATLIMAGKDFVIDNTVGTSKNDCPADGQLQGIFSADHNITISGNQGRCDVSQDTALNVDGAFIVNAARQGGKLVNDRDLCGDNPKYPSLTFKARPDFLLNVPGFLTKQQTVSHEDSP